MIAATLPPPVEVVHERLQYASLGRHAAENLAHPITVAELRAGKHWQPPAEPSPQAQVVVALDDPRPRAVLHTAPQSSLLRLSRIGRRLVEMAGAA